MDQRPQRSWLPGPDHKIGRTGRGSREPSRLPGRRHGPRALHERPVTSLLCGFLVIICGVAFARFGVTSGFIAVEPSARVESTTFLEHSVDELIVASADEFEELKAKLLAKRDGNYRVDVRVESVAQGVRQIRASLIDTATGREMDHIVTYQQQER